MGIIRDAYNYTPSNQGVWRKQKILSLAIFVRLEYVFKLRSCYLTAKVYTSVIVRLEEEEYSNIQNDSAYPIDQFCSWKSSDLFAKYQENKTDILIQKQFFLHVTNYVAKKHWDISDANVKSSGYLYILMSDK